jgi:hypothetical protein
VLFTCCCTLTLTSDMLVSNNPCLAPCCGTKIAKGQWKMTKELLPLAGEYDLCGRCIKVLFAAKLDNQRQSKMGNVQEWKLGLILKYDSKSDCHEIQFNGIESSQVNDIICKNLFFVTFQECLSFSCQLVRLRGRSFRVSPVFKSEDDGQISKKHWQGVERAIEMLALE